MRACWMKVSDEDGGALGALGRDHGSWGKKRGIYSLRGSSPRPMAHKTIALTTELRELGRLVLGFHRLRRGSSSKFLGLVCALFGHGAHGVVVSHPLSMREALGSIPSVSIFLDRVELLCLSVAFVILCVRGMVPLRKTPRPGIEPGSSA